MERSALVIHGTTYLVEELSIEDGDYWPRVGPVLANKTIRRDLGGMIDTDDGYRWIFISLDGEPVGFCCLNTGVNGVMWFDNAYVYPAYRDAGIHSALIDLRLGRAQELGAAQINVFAMPSSYAAYEQRGFRQIKARGQYRTYTKELR